MIVRFWFLVQLLSFGEATCDIHVFHYQIQC